MKQDWTRGKIRYELEKVGVTNFFDLDRSSGLPLGTCSNAIREPRRNGEAVIAKALNRHPKIIWPSRYDVKGDRLTPQPSRNYRDGRNDGQCQKGARK